MKKFLGVLLFVFLGFLMVSPTQAVSADATTTTVSYQVNKAGTDKPSVANSFFSGEATVTRSDDGPATVTLHLVKFASTIKSFAIGDQVAKITNATANTADLSFVVDNSFQLPVVQAAMTVMNMHQKADLVFDEALYQPELSTATVADQAKSDASKTPVIGTDPTADAETSRPVTDAEPLDQAATAIAATDSVETVDESKPAAIDAKDTTEIVAYQVNKAGTDTPSLSNSFFTGQAEVTVKNGRATSVTLHLQKFANMIKSFSVGDQPAKMTNVTSNTADLTFVVDEQFAKPIVQASMSVMNMNQKADLVFTKALYQAAEISSQPKVSTPIQSSQETNGSTATEISATDHSTDAVTPATKPEDSAPAQTSPETDVTPTTESTATKPTTDATTLTTQSEDSAETQTSSTTDPKTDANTPTTEPKNSTKSQTAPVTIAKPGTVETTEQSQTVSESKASDQGNSTSTNSTPATQTETATQTVKYHVNKTGTDTPSISDSFFTGQATIITKAGQPQTVTLHIQQHAGVISSFSIGSQQAKMTNTTADTADLTFTIDKQFAQPVVTASLTVMGMTQKADLVFAEALYQSASSEAKPTETQTSTIANQTPKSAATKTPTTNTAVDHQATTGEGKASNQSPATTPMTSATTTDANKAVAKSPSSRTSTEIVKYQVNKVGTDTPSIANGFFTGEATVTLTAGQAQTVTLHLQKYASAIKTFTIGDQTAKMSNVAGDTGDLTFTIDANFAKPVVQARMSVMNMNQTADLVFAKALYQTSSTEPTRKNPISHTQSAPVASAKPNVLAKSQTQITTPSKQAGEVSAKLYQAQNGHLTTAPSAAQQFISQSAKVVRHATNTTVTLHTTGAEYIQAMRIAGQLGKITNRHGANADLVFTLSNQVLNYALPVTFSLVVPGAGAMTQSAFLLLDLPVQAAQVDPVVKPFTTTTTSAAPVRPVVAGAPAHAINAKLAQQTITYTVLDAGGSALSTANQYFTHSARVVKAGAGYDVYLTVRVAAGLVTFTPISINGGAVHNLSHAVIGGQDVWTFDFHVANANGLDQLIPASILMSVPMANISNQAFNIEFAFARLAQSEVASAETQSMSSAVKTKALKPITITKKTVKPAGKTTSTTQITSSGLKARSVLPKLKHYPIGWEALAFILADGLILIGAWIMRRRRLGEVTHD